MNKNGSRIKSAASSTSNWIRSQDKFGAGFGIKMDAGVDKNKTHMGTFCTLLWFVIIMSYAANKIDILINKKDTSILAATRDLYFSSQD